MFLWLFTNVKIDPELVKWYVSNNHTSFDNHQVTFPFPGNEIIILVDVAN